MLGEDKSALTVHHCYGCLTLDALEHIAREGAVKELIDHLVFDFKLQDKNRFFPHFRKSKRDIGSTPQPTNCRYPNRILWIVDPWKCKFALNDFVYLILFLFLSFFLSNFRHIVLRFVAR